MSLLASKQPPIADVAWPDHSLLRAIILVFAGALVLAISSKLSIPMAPKSLFPVPVTLQTLVALAVGTAYGWRLGGATVLLYFSLGAMGLPVFAQGGGLHHLWTAPTAGYLHGFLFGAVLMGWFASLGLDRSAVKLFPAMLAGHAVIFFFGLMWLASYVGMNAALTIGFKPFVIADILKCALGAQLFPIAWKALKE